MKRRYIQALSIALAVFGLDQLTKVLVKASLPHGASITLVPGLFDLVHVRNRGAAFGLLNRPDQSWQTWMFAGASILALIVILWMLRKTPDKDGWTITGLGLVLGGALGNLLDRVTQGYVVDFLDVYYRGWHWPAFNVADMAICIGAGSLILAFWKGEHVSNAG